ncbi:MAG TPA: hypothetical protein VFP12_07140 [Allosphingosinicella sp.]|nr:hypothetical protein [Allosphingosinicella sp.]
MIARGFKSVIWVATVGSAALACYMVSLRVATERNELLKVERQIVAAKRDIRSLQTELGTRGRMTQLEQWNAEVLALAAPSSAQFLKDEFTLARLYRNDPTVADRSAEVRLASADTAAAKPAETAKPATPPVVQAVAERPAATQPPLIHRASFTTAEAPAKPKPSLAKPDKPDSQRTASAAPLKPESKPTAKPGKPAAQRTAAAATVKPEATVSRSTAKPAAKPETLRTAATAKPLREAAAAPRVKGKGGGGN